MLPSLCSGGESNCIGRFTICGSKGMIISTVMFNAEGELEYTIVADGETPYVSNKFTVLNAKVVEKIHKTIGY